MGRKADRSKRARAAIERSFEDRQLVRVTRTPAAAGPVDGVVVGRGVRWVLLKRLSPDLDLDGYTAVRWKHLQKVQPFDPRSIPARATAPPTSAAVAVDRVDATTTGSLLRSISSAFVPVGVHTEDDGRSSPVIGEVSLVADKRVHVLVLGPSAGATASPVVISFESITRVDFDGRYLRNLARAAGRCASRHMLST